MIQDVENHRKKMVDGMAAVLLDIDERSVRRKAREVAKAVIDCDEVRRIVVSGGAGAGKTVFSQALAHELQVPCFDFDEYIPGGYTHDKTVYAARLKKGFEKLWDDLPHVRPWVVEHVHACSSDIVDLLGASLAIHLDPGVSHLKSVAQARDLVGEDTNGKRALRASETAISSKTHFRALPGRIVFSRDGLQMKLISRT